MGGGSSKPISNVDPVTTAIQMQTSCNGNPLPIMYGKSRVTGNILWYGAFTPVPHVQNTGGDGGGKGGGGGGGSTQTSWTYTVSFAMALCEGLVASTGQMWSGKNKIATVDASVFNLFSGADNQATWAYMDSLFPAQSLNYRGVGYLSAADFDLGDATALPSLSFEVVGPFSNANCTYGGASPADIVYDILTNARYGAGFPSSKIGSITVFQNYCGAMGLFLSPIYDTQVQVAQILTDLMQITNSGVYFSEGVLKIVPYGDQNITGNGYTYTAPISTLINLGEDDFIVDSPSDDPVLVKRNAIPTTANTSSDAWNQVSVEYLNRLNEYNQEICQVQDQNSIDTFGLLPMDTVTAHQITDPTAAHAAASLILQRSVYIRNQYEFRLGWNYAYLEPTDIVTLTDTAIGLNLKPVRILIVEEDEKGTLTITAEDAPPGVASRIQVTPGSGSGYAANYNIDPGNVFAPVFFELAMADITGSSGIELGIAATGQAGKTGWGGCNVWVSNDGTTYSQAGQITARGRVGHLTANMTSGSATLSLLLDGLGGQILSGTAADQTAMATLLCIPGASFEYLTYQDATLTGQNAYDLGTLARGQYNTAAAAHSIGDQIVRVDGAVLKGAAINTGMIGKTLFFKFCSFNVYGLALQQLSAVNAYQYVVTGQNLKAPLQNLTGLKTFVRGNQTFLSWDKATDPARAVDYEIRCGASWQSAQVLGWTSNLEYATSGDGTYWVSVHSTYAYSATPSSISLSGTFILKNVAASWDEKSTGWTGTMNVCSVNGANEVALTAGQLIGNYTIPVGHEVDVGTVQPCNVTVNYVFRADAANALFSAVPLVSALGSVAGNYAGLASLNINIAVADITGTYGAWKTFTPGIYVGRKFKFKVQLTSTQPSIIAVLSSFSFTVDMPDRNERGANVAILAAGSAITYATPFQVAPSVQIAIVNPTAGDQIFLTPQSTAGFTVQIKNAGTGVARTINWLSQGY